MALYKFCIIIMIIHIFHSFKIYFTNNWRGQGNTRCACLPPSLRCLQLIPLGDAAAWLKLCDLFYIQPSNH